MKCDICKAEMKHVVADIHRCPSDGLLSSDLKPNPNIYGEDYHRKHALYANNEINKRLQDCRRGFVEKVLQRKDNLRLLDYGCGSGAFLQSLNGQFVVKNGFDINPYEKFTRTEVLFNDYDVVTMWDVLEHLESPKSFLSALRSKYVFITVPCVGDLNALGLDIENITKWRHYRPNEHLHYFDIGSMESLLEASGYELYGFNYNESEVRKGGKDKNLLSVCGRRVWSII